MFAESCFDVLCSFANANEELSYLAKIGSELRFVINIDSELRFLAKYCFGILSVGKY